MNSIAPGNRLTPVLLAACVLLGLVLMLEWYALSRESGSTPASKTQPASTTDALLTRSVYSAPDFAAFSEIIERPLFTEGRVPPQPPETSQASASPAKQTPLTLRLEGIALTPVARVVLVRDLSSNKQLRLAEGDRHQGWVLESIQATGATFKRGEQTRELLLEIGKKSPGRYSGPARNKHKR